MADGESGETTRVYCSAVMAVCVPTTIDGTGGHFSPFFCHNFILDGSCQGIVIPALLGYRKLNTRLWCEVYKNGTSAFNSCEQNAQKDLCDHL